MNISQKSHPLSKRQSEITNKDNVNIKWKNRRQYSSSVKSQRSRCLWDTNRVTVARNTHHQSHRPNTLPQRQTHSILLPNKQITSISNLKNKSKKKRNRNPKCSIDLPINEGTLLLLEMASIIKTQTYRVTNNNKWGALQLDLMLRINAVQIRMVGSFSDESVQ